ncbi:MAG: right-handed parallel beta-helix repeat-containing protein [Bacteroidetes bacterium]|nr:right-handed parallel beta-helix repeat-containing protein [Bacteroidota bacterium]
MKKLFLLFALIGITYANAQDFCHPHKAVSPIALTNVGNKTISGDSINVNGGSDICLSLTNCHDIHITNCWFGNSTHVGVFLYKCANIRIDSCYVTKLAAGVYAVDSYAISVTDCEGKNMIGPFPRGEFVQFNNVSGPRCRINNNRFESIFGESYPEDAINVYKCHGTPNDPIQVIGNKIRGGGPSKSGGGIMLGDNGGSYITAQNNILVNPGQYGMAIAGGDHIRMVNNTIYSKQREFTNVGFYIWAQAQAACSLDEISGNRVNWTKKDGRKNHKWNGGNCGDVKGWESNVIDTTVDESILPEQLLSPCHQ